MYSLERIKTTCFWDYDFSFNELSDMAQNGDKNEKKFLFAKILENSTDALNDIGIFTLQDRKTLLRDYNISDFKKEYIQKRYDILRHFILGDTVYIKELAWRL